MAEDQPFPRLRAITFDLDFTLWDLTGVIQQAEDEQYAHLLAHYPRVCGRFSAEDLQALRTQLALERPELRHNVTELRKAALRFAGEACGYDEGMVDAAFGVFLDARHQVQLFDDALPLLKRLREHYVLGVITNGNADVGRLGLRGRFDFVLSPMDVGAAKPDRIIFEAACNLAGHAPDAVMHVGDEPESDVIGAADHGMEAVWLNRQGLAWPENLPPRPYHQVDSLKGLAALLGLALQP